MKTLNSRTMFTTPIFSRLLFLIFFVALAAEATPAIDVSRQTADVRPSNNGFCSAVPPPADSNPSCGSPDHPDNQPAFENMFSGVTRGPKVRCVNDSSIFTYHIIRTVQRLTPGRTSQSQDLALWMFVEFLKAAPLFMGLGCIMTVFVALRQKWSDLTDSEASIKIRWTKPAAC